MRPEHGESPELRAPRTGGDSPPAPGAFPISLPAGAYRGGGKGNRPQAAIIPTEIRARGFTLYLRNVTSVSIAMTCLGKFALLALLLIIVPSHLVCPAMADRIFGMDVAD